MALSHEQQAVLRTAYIRLARAIPFVVLAASLVPWGVLRMPRETFTRRVIRLVSMAGIAVCRTAVYGVDLLDANPAPWYFQYFRSPIKG